MAASLKTSRFNYYARVQDGFLAFNARTGTFALVSEKIHNRLTSSQPLRMREPLAGKLESMGFAYRNDEVGPIQRRFFERKPQGDSLYITILPSLQCNYSCNYCYQDQADKKHIMTIETQQGVLRYVHKHMTGGIKNIKCTWYGGEPLLFKDIVLRVSDELNAMAIAAGGKLNMSIITNGSLLSSDTVKALVLKGLEHAQVSFDALLSDGNRKRGLLDSSGKPSAILQNCMAAREFVEIKARVNVTRTNLSELHRMYEVLEEYGLGDCYHIARVIDYRKSETCTKESTFEVSELEFIDLFKLSFRSPKSIHRIFEMLTPRSQFCGATGGRSLVIDPHGNVSYCWHSSATPLEAVGNVNDSVQKWDDSEVYQKWSDYSPFKSSRCTHCAALPVCMGGCPHHRIFENVCKPQCMIDEQIIQFYVNKIAENLNYS